MGDQGSRPPKLRLRGPFQVPWHKLVSPLVCLQPWFGLCAALRPQASCSLLLQRQTRPRFLVHGTDEDPRSEDQRAARVGRGEMRRSQNVSPCLSPATPSASSAPSLSFPKPFPTSRFTSDGRDPAPRFLSRPQGLGVTLPGHLGQLGDHSEGRHRSRALRHLLEAEGRRLGRALGQDRGIGRLGRAE